MTSSNLGLKATLLALSVASAPAYAADVAPADGWDFDFAIDLQDDNDAVAQDDDDDEEDSVKEEREAVESGDIKRAGPGADDDDLEALNEKRERRTIKVLQKKNFLKIGRGEAGAHIGFVSNDPFINRYLAGLNVGYHVTEVFSVELSGTFSPDFGESDWKPITDQLVNENAVSPDISKLIWVVNATAQFSPIYGKIAVVGGRIIVFDFYGLFGMGMAGTKDDDIAIQCDLIPGEACTETLTQVHPTTTIGGGFRVAFSKRVAARIEGRSLSYVEVLNGTSLEMKNNFILQAMGTIFFDVRRN